MSGFGESFNQSEPEAIRRSSARPAICVTRQNVRHFASEEECTYNGLVITPADPIETNNEFRMSLRYIIFRDEHLLRD